MVIFYGGYFRMKLALSKPFYQTFLIGCGTFTYFILFWDSEDQLARRSKTAGEILCCANVA